MEISDFEQQLRDEIMRRQTFYAELEKSAILRHAAMLECKGDIFKFVNNFVWLDRNQSLITAKDFEDTIPLILFQYQIDLIKEIWDCIEMGIAPVDMRTKATSIFIEKSRQMGITEIISIVFIY
jgi:hypothetical protein